MNKPLVSVIIPLYNASSYIEATLDSVCQQTYTNLEILVVDDSSTDDGFKKVKAYSDSRIILLQQVNSGAAIARNTGLQQAKGDYIQFMDADDLLHPDKIKIQVEALHDKTAKIAVSNYIEFFDEENLYHKTVPKSQNEFIFSSDKPVDFLLNLWGANGNPNFIQTNSWLLPKSLIDKAGMWRAYRCPDDDGEFFARVILASSGVIYTEGAINYYRRFLTEGNLSNHKNAEAIQNTLLTLRLKQEYIEEFEKSQRVNRAFARQYLNFSVYNYIRNKKLSIEAYHRYKQLKTPLPLPKIGGKLIQTLAMVLGWKTALKLKNILKYEA